MIRFLLYIPRLIYYIFIKENIKAQHSNAITIFQETTKSPSRGNFLTCMNYIQQHQGRYILCKQIDITKNIYDTSAIDIYYFKTLLELMETIRKYEMTDDISDDKYLYLLDYMVKNNHKYVGINNDIQIDFLSSPENISLYLRMLSVARLSYTSKLYKKLRIIYFPFLLLKRS